MSSIRIHDHRASLAVAALCVSAFFAAPAVAAPSWDSFQNQGTLLAGVRGGDWNIPEPRTAPAETAKTSPALAQAKFEKLLRLVKQQGRKSTIPAHETSMLGLSQPDREWPARAINISDEDGHHSVHIGDADSGQVVFVLIAEGRLTLLRADRSLALVSALSWTKEAESVLLDAPEAALALDKELAFWAQAVD